MAPDVCIQFDDNRTATTNMINKISGGRSSYEDRWGQNVRRQTLGNSLIVN